VFENNERFRPVIQDQLSASAAWRNDRKFTIGFLWLWVTDGDDGIHGSVTLEQGAGKRDGLGTDRHATDGGTKMNAGPNAAVRITDRSCDGMPEWLIMVGQDLVGGGDKLVILWGERERLFIIQPLRLPLPRPGRRAWRWRQGRRDRGFCVQLRPQGLCGHGGTVSHSLGPGRSAGCRS
jgi:hypothetical protein